MKRLFLAAMLVVGVAGMALATTTDEIRISSGALTATITDYNGSTGGTCSGTGCGSIANILGIYDTAAAAGTVTASSAATSFDGWTITFASGTSNSPVVTPFGIDIGSFTATCDTTKGCASDDLTITFSDQNFTSVVTGFNTFFSGTITSGSATQTAYVDTSNTLFGQPAGGKIGSVTLNAPGGSGGASASIAAGPSPYSLTLVNVVKAGSTGVSIDGNITAVPEPGSLMLLGSGLLGFASIARKKLFKS